ncbi:sensor histidine kinase inhibitor, KipI family [Lentzea albidocapillata subsp. violacea]|uniref:Sensor histidine kinase inhibitor, KipI family n=1 Tax=Lentzea albidocapillata subsp. violacea TaxID=128104 RepID=A0A1G9LPF3_9PSEU|nr:5-oxoprolinase subunit PxpB [Lentzea albidocapillata]SDL63796.1 sensor histidine kinase inhibitor, KipI family [Lentzea albidocapillata subsp. violacea]
MLLRRCGTDALLIEVDSLSEVAAVRAALENLDGIEELVPAARTVLVKGALTQVRDALKTIDLTKTPAKHSREITIPVIYDGPDLALVAETAGSTPDEVVRLHTTATYEVAFCGFAPGFAYLTGLPEALQQPRLDSPRTKVPQGSVGIAGEFTAAYPRPTPGGWRLIGRTETTLFDAKAKTPALLQPGDQVRFVVA